MGKIRRTMAILGGGDEIPLINKMLEGSEKVISERTPN